MLVSEHSHNTSHNVKGYYTKSDPGVSVEEIAVDIQLRDLEEAGLW